MAKYSKETRKTANGSESVRYRDGNKYVGAEEVPEVVRTALEERRDGQIVDELGDDFDPETDLDEGSGEEQAPTTDNTGDDEGDQDDDLDEEPETPAPKPAAKPRPRRSRTTAQDEYDEEGMGFPRVNGKTVDIFDGKTPHTHVKPVAGFMVPLSADSFANKSDVEIQQKLKELGKIS